MIVDLPSFESFLVTLIVTAVRTIIEASPTILGGIAVTAWLRTQATPEKVASIFSGDGVRGSLRTVLVGMSLPVCSIGILPVLRELRLLGLPTSKLITLGVAAPLLNPFSLLFGLALSFSQYSMMVVVGGLVAIVIGDISSRFNVKDSVNSAVRPAGLTGGTRLRNLLVAASRLMTGRVLLDLVVTIAVAALALAFIRYGSFLILCEASNRSGPAVVSILTLAQYISPSRAIIHFAGIQDANLAPAAGLAIYVFGTGIGGAGIVTFCKWYGWRRLVALAIAYCLVVIAAVYCLSYTLPAPVAGVAETSAVDNLTRPAYDTLGNVDKALGDSFVFLNTSMFFSLFAVFVLMLVGVYVRFAKVDFRSDDPEEASRQNAGRMAKAIPASQLGAVAIFGMGIVFCLSAYVYFQSPGEVFESMERAHLDASVEIRSGNVVAAIDQIAAWDAAAASIPIGAAIRGAFPTPMQRQLMRELRMELRFMRGLLDKGDLKSARAKLSGLRRLLSKTKESFANKSAIVGGEQ